MKIIPLVRKSITVLFCLACFRSAAAAQVSSFAYVDSKTIATLEFSNRHHATINLFNMSNYLVALKAQSLWVVAESGEVYIGQVIAGDKPRPDENLYVGTFLMEPWSYKALEVIGVYAMPNTIRQVILVLGGKRLVFKPAEAAEMEELAARIQEVDLSLRNGPQIIQRANISLRGTMSYPSGEQDDLDLAVKRILGPEDINPPRILSRSNPLLTGEARKAGLSQVQVKLNVSLDKNGEIQDIKTVKEIGYGLDQRAIASVRNSWKFLPATQYSEPTASTAVIVVQFSESPP